LAGQIDPERASGWLGVAMPLIREGGPVVTLVVMLLGALVIWWLLGALGRAQMTNRELVERLLTCVEERGEWKYRAPAQP
jgi:hypothetical protein